MVGEVGLNDRSFLQKGDVVKVLPNKEIRCQSIIDIYTGLLKIRDFIYDRLGHAPLNVMDYGTDDGYVGVKIAEMLNAENLVLVNRARDSNIEAVRMADKSSRIEHLMIDNNGVPKTGLGFDVIMLNDVVWALKDEEGVKLFESLVSMLSDRGVIIIVQTDDSEHKLESTQRMYGSIAKDNPELLNKILFIMPNRKMLEGSGGLSDEVSTFVTKTKKSFKIVTINSPISSTIK